MDGDHTSMSGRGRVIVAATLAAACAEDEPSVCDYRQVSSPTGSIRWTDGVMRLPDRVYVYRDLDAEPVRECSFEPPLSGDETIGYACPEGYAGQATLSVLLDRQRWN